MDIDFRWGGDPSIVLAVQTALGASIPIQLKDLQVFTIVRVIFQLADEIPCISAVVAALLSEPEPRIDYTLKAVGGSLTAIPGLSDMIDDTMNSIVTDSLQWPHRIVVPLGGIPVDIHQISYLPSHLELKPQGKLTVTVVKANDLKNMELIGKSDPYTVVYIRPLFKVKTKVIDDNLNPVWDETFNLIVEDKETQSLILEIWDIKSGARERILRGVASRFDGDELCGSQIRKADSPLRRNNVAGFSDNGAGPNTSNSPVESNCIRSLEESIAGKRVEAEETFNCMCRAGIKPDHLAYSVMLDILFRFNETKKAMVLYQEMLSSNFRPDRALYEVMLDNIGLCTWPERETLEEFMLPSQISFTTINSEHAHRSGLRLVCYHASSFPKITAELEPCLLQGSPCGKLPEKLPPCCSWPPPSLELSRQAVLEIHMLHLALMQLCSILSNVSFAQWMTLESRNFTSCFRHMLCQEAVAGGKLEKAAREAMDPHLVMTGGALSTQPPMDPLIRLGLGQATVGGAVTLLKMVMPARHLIPVAGVHRIDYRLHPRSQVRLTDTRLKIMMDYNSQGILVGWVSCFWWFEYLN
ncbi:hypothetical protein NL676_028405 [Syzygium grande]|nr:hypothetical protein NL676_028405 [Syzygium grande]